MIRIGTTAERNPAATSRRDFLQIGGASFLGLSLAGWFRAQAMGAVKGGSDTSCILLFLWGGPPHSDIFDLKPEAPDAYRGQFKPMPTRVPGMQICEHLPRLARASRLYTIVRSAHHNDTEHPRGAHFMMTGNAVIRGQEWPNMGATINKYGGNRDGGNRDGGNQYAGEQNPIGSVVIGPRLIDSPITPTGQDGGFLGNAYAPFRVADPTLPLEKIASMAPPPALGTERGARRRRLFRTITDLQRQVESDDTLALDSACERAFALATSPRAKAAFDLSREPEPIRERYGRYSFGQGALMARRLVEAGVRFVQVNWREHPINEYGFDNHGDNFSKLKDHQLPQIDQTVSALLEDLDARGLLEKTVVLATGEFGRTPKINGAAGRDHWPFVFSYLIAGGGIPGGHVIGSSDEIAAYPVDDPVSPGNTVASIYSLVGLDLEKLKAAKIVEETEGIPRLLG